MREHGYTPPQNIEYNRFMRFAAPNKPKGNKSAWLKISSDGKCAVFGNWISGIKHVWFDKSTYSPVEKAEIYEKLNIEILREKELQQRQYEQVALQVKEILANAKPASNNHPYLQKKRVKPYGLYQTNHLQGMYNALLMRIKG